MMKRNILAVAIPALLVTGAASAAEVYNKDSNKVDMYDKTTGLHYFSKHNGENAYAVNGDQTYVRLGFKGETQINDQLTGYGQWGYQFSGNNSEGDSDAQNGNKTRLASAGLKFDDANSSDYGRDYGVMYDALDYIDMLPEFGGDTAASDQFLSQYNGGLATYHNASFFDLIEGLSFVVQYPGENEHDGVRRSNGDDVGGSISYGLDGFDVVGAYDAADRTDAQQNPALRGHGDRAEQRATSVKYDANNIYLVANYSETRNATRVFNGHTNKTGDVLLVAQYQFGFNLRLSFAYTKSKGEGTEGIGDADLVNYFEVGVTHYFSKSMSTYVDCITNQIDSDNKLGVGSDGAVAVGIVYQF